MRPVSFSFSSSGWGGGYAWMSSLRAFSFNDTYNVWLRCEWMQIIFTFISQHRFSRWFITLMYDWSLYIIVIISLPISGFSLPQDQVFWNLTLSGAPPCSGASVLHFDRKSLVQSNWPSLNVKLCRISPFKTFFYVLVVICWPSARLFMVVISFWFFAYFFMNLNYRYAFSLYTVGDYSNLNHDPQYVSLFLNYLL